MSHHGVGRPRFAAAEGRRRYIAVGRFKKQTAPFGSLLTDRAITTALIEWLDDYLSFKPTAGNKSKGKHSALTVEIFRTHVNDIYTEELSMLKRGGPKGKDGKKAISTETARKWLHILGYSVNVRSIVSYAGAPCLLLYSCIVPTAVS